MSAIVKRHSPFAGKRSIALKDLISSPLILMGRDSSVRTVVDRALAAIGHFAAPAYEASYISTALGMVEAGLGVAILPASVLHMGGARGLVSRPIHNPRVDREVGFIQVRGRTPSPAAGLEHNDSARVCGGNRFHQVRNTVAAAVNAPAAKGTPAIRSASYLLEVLPGFKLNTRPFDLEFTEALKVGYKWYDAQGKQPLFPFGFGLSYTSFVYADLQIAPGRTPAVHVTVKNTGARAGAEAVQIYAALPAAAEEPFKRLVGWDKVRLAPGESKTVTIEIDPKYLSIFNVTKDAWELLPGEYAIHAGASSRDLRLTGSLGIR